MARMKTFFTYALIVILFYLFSNFAIDIMISNSYTNLSNNVEIEKSNNGFEINVEKANSNKRQGYFEGTVKNTSNKVIDKQYVKVDSYYKGRLMQSKYLAFENMQPGEERKFKLRYSVGNIDEYKVSYVDEIPVNRTMIDDAIDTIIRFIDNAKEKANGLTLKGTADNIKGAFVPVHVEGEDWQLFVAVMTLIYLAPAGAFIIF